MPDTWKQWEGHAVDGKFPLIRYLGGSEHRAVFLTERRVGELPVKAAIKLVAAAPEDGELQLSRWQRAAKLSHPNLVSLHETGRCELGGKPLLYVVMEYAEENLAQIVPARALTPDESRAMLEPVLEALAYLQSKNFVHGHIKPENILASSDRVKVSSDGLCRVGESPIRGGYHDAYEPPENAGGIIPMAQTMSPACDVWSLGVTLVEVLTQNPPVARTEERQDPLLPQTLPEPFLDIASHCLRRHPQSRWTITQIAARLENRSAAPEERPPASAPRPAVRPPRSSANRRKYIVPVAAGFALVLAAILVGPRLLHRASEAPQIPDAAGREAPGPSAPGPVMQSPQDRPNNPLKTSSAKEELRTKIPVPVPTSIHKETIDEEETRAVEKPPASNLVHGEVAQQVLPEVLQSARDSIRGTVRVAVTANVDRQGNVEDADLEAPGPSKYFARAALQAARLWKFKPPKAGNQNVLSTWTIRFEFTHDGTNVVPTQEAP
jgi:TonB family protein